MSRNDDSGERGSVHRRRLLKAAGTTAALGAVPATVSANQQDVYIDAYIHKTSEVNDKRIDQAKDALEKFEYWASQSPYLELNVYSNTGYTSLDNGKSPGTDNDARREWEDYVEGELNSRGYLDDGKLHVPLYNQSEGAGFSTWNVGADEDANDDPYTNDHKENRSYEYSAGKYGFANVNVATGNWPFNRTWFKATVMHETGHLFGAKHKHGGISEKNGDYYATPMCTWYVEQDCYSKYLNPEPNSLCYDDSGSKDACKHELKLTYCTWDAVADWCDNHL